ncbi:MAG: nucleotide exchange factor GrpE [Actinomycetota bacterium]|nr:MAG: molecular chaperone [Actinomycetota bacterium]MDO8949893.1 nucleotide exchange factor GrpE [Actinomycetota bacterium]MDP3630776.1 nucleotide exchange factor GrpE [Actinomycetota bacterium]
MVSRKSNAGAGDPPGASAPFDPELVADLGAEFDLRGDNVERELEAARTEAAGHLETAQRLQAEFENYRRRVTREQADSVARAGKRIVEELLPVLDNLERAIAHTTAGGDLAQLVTGVGMVHQQVLDVFGKEGVEIIDPLGEEFDPQFHQAVGQHEDVSVPDNSVVEVLQKGYLLGGRVVRPAMVIVGSGGPARKG